MSIYTTLYINRKKAEEYVAACRAKKDRSVQALSAEELDSELHEYVYSDKHHDIIPWPNNFIITEDEKLLNNNL